MDDKVKANREKFQAMLKPIQSDIEKLVRGVNNAASGTCISGFIFSQHPAGFVKFGNINNTSDELIHLHIVLASLAADMQECPDGVYRNVPFVEVGLGNLSMGEEPEKIADELARMLIISGADESRLDEILGLAQRYVMARRPDAPK
jgi:hypothetical protein